MAYAFSSGTLQIGGQTIGTLQDISLDVSFQTIPLQGNMRFPVAIAKGPGKITGTAKSGEILTLMSSITNEVMAPPDADLALVWTITDTEGNDVVLTLANVSISSWKLSSGSDKWLVTDISFEAAASLTSSTVLTVS